MLVYGTICAHMHKLCSLNQTNPLATITAGDGMRPARFKLFFSKSDNY